jgi:uncharacterized protein DUF4838
MKFLPVHLALILLVSFSLAEKPDAAPPTVPLAKDGKAQLDIILVTPTTEPEPKKGKAVKNRTASNLEKAGDDLRRCLQRMTGTEFVLRSVPKCEGGKPGIYVGTAADFPWAQLPKDLAPEEVLLRTTADSQLFLIGGSTFSTVHAVYTFLEGLGCRWFFPGDAWEVIPKQPAVTVALHQRQKPDIGLQRTLAVGHGPGSAQNRQAYEDWVRRNKLGQPFDMPTSHAWLGISPKKDFTEHPEWFGLVAGVRKPSKPCYAHPEVIARGIAAALAYFDKNPAAHMISVSPDDGIGFCECERCQQLAKVSSIYSAHGPGGIFGKTANGVEVSVPSEPGLWCCHCISPKSSGPQYSFTLSNLLGEFPPAFYR